MRMISCVQVILFDTGGPDGIASVVYAVTYFFRIVVWRRVEARQKSSGSVADHSGAIALGTRENAEFGPRWEADCSVPI
jgi:hypothetical protein